MPKDFDKWNTIKKDFELESRTLFAHQREIWWCSLGINLGAEIDGKNDNFERPVLILKVYNKESMFILPITSKEKKDKFHYKLIVKERNVTGSEKAVWIKLTQAKVISNKRLLRKVDVVSEGEFTKITSAFKESL